MTTPSKLRASGRNQLVRPRFSPGLMLEDTDLTQGVDYARELNRLMFRSLLGCGVMCGLKVTLHTSCGVSEVRIAPGVALTGCGDPIHVPAQQVIALDPTTGGQSDKLWVVLQRREYACMPRETGCCIDEDMGDTVRTRLVDGFEIRLLSGKESPEDSCGCDGPQPGQSEKDAETARLACYQHRADGECECDCGSEMVLLGFFADIEAAKKTEQAKSEKGKLADHSVRRYVAPELMRDPLLKAEAEASTKEPEVKPPDPKEEQRLKVTEKLLQAHAQRNKAGAEAENLRQEWSAADDARKEELKPGLDEADAGVKALDDQVAKLLDELAKLKAS